MISVLQKRAMQKGRINKWKHPAPQEGGSRGQPSGVFLHFCKCSRHTIYSSSSSLAAVGSLLDRPDITENAWIRSFLLFANLKDTLQNCCIILLNNGLFPLLQCTRIQKNRTITHISHAISQSDTHTGNLPKCVFLQQHLFWLISCLARGWHCCLTVHVWS